MANNCFYQCRIASESRDAVEQFVNVLKYRDLKNGYYMCRIFSAEPDEWVTDSDGVRRPEVLQSDNGIYYIEVSGDCAWSVGGCMIGDEYMKWRDPRYGEARNEVWRDYEGEICFSNIGVTASQLCKILGCGFECWSKECGMCFQEHYLINADGEVIRGEECHWEEGYDLTEDGKYADLNPDKDIGGFKDYGCFTDPYDLVVRMCR